MRRDLGAARNWLIIGGAVVVVAAVVIAVVVWPSSTTDDNRAAPTTSAKGQAAIPGALTGERFFDLPCEPIKVRKDVAHAANLLTGEGLQVDIDGGSCPLQFTGKPGSKFYGASTAQTRNDEMAFIGFINQSRQQGGLGGLQVLAPIAGVSREHSEFMRDKNSLEHTSDLPSKFPPEWQALGENVGKGKGVTVDQLHQAFMNSPAHRANIMDPDYNYVGLGVRYAADGTLWVTEEFMKGPQGLTDSPFPVPASEAPAVGGPSRVPNNEWYFADGFTGSGFLELLNILNPGGSAATVSVDYVIGGNVQRQTVAAPPHSRTVVSVNQAVGPNQEVSVVARSDQPVVVERQMQFVYSGKWQGETTLIGSQPATAFFFAEGYTGPNFEEFLTLFNPNAQAVQATVSYQFSDGTNRDDAVSLGPQGRTTINVNDAVGPNRELSVAVTAPKPIVVERPMYFAYDGRLDDGHTSSGMAAPATHIIFAEGYTGPGFFEYLTIQNPGAAPANVDITYLLGGGGTQGQAVTVGPKSRFTVSVHEVVPNREVSMDLTSDQPIVAERPMYFTYKGRVLGGHDVVGTPTAATQWLFPGGDTTTGTDTYLTVANPQGNPVTLTVTFFDDGGGTTVRNFSVPASARQTIEMAREAGSDRVVSALVSASAPVVAEQPTYTVANVNAGSDVTGFPVS